jgi:hypothetical protein
MIYVWEIAASSAYFRHRSWSNGLYINWGKYPQRVVDQSVTGRSLMVAALSCPGGWHAKVL